MSSSFVLGLVVLLGVPVLVMSLSFVIRPLQARQREQREEVGRLTALGADTVSGLRVLRGIGGEQVFLARYRDRSEQVRKAGVRVALPQSTLDSAQVLLPGIFVVIVTWLGARLAVEGRIRPGELRDRRQGDARVRWRRADAGDPQDQPAGRRADSCCR